MNTTTLSAAAALQPNKDIEAATRILSCLLQGFSRAIDVRFWDGTHTVVGAGQPAFGLTINDPKWLSTLVAKGSPLVLAEAHFRGHLDYSGSVFDVLSLRVHFEQLKLTMRDRMQLMAAAWRLRTAGSNVADDRQARKTGANGFLRAHTRESDKDAIAYHYDIGNEFYALWLDEWVYSCAYFESPSDSLATAQQRKLDMVCRKLRLKPGERFLDIGCGWGSMLIWAAKNYGVHAHGITLSEEQLSMAQKRIKAEGLGGLVTVELRDYRDLEGTFDKISSIGMFEHVGLANLASYNACVHRLLADGGLFLNHGITHDTAGWNTGLNSNFLAKWVFPDGELDRVSSIQGGMEAAGFEIIDVEAMRSHYALTLRRWVDRLQSVHSDAVQHVSETTYRVWVMYMAASAIEFENGGTGIHQILAGKTRDMKRTDTLTREHLLHGNA